MSRRRNRRKPHRVQPVPQTPSPTSERSRSPASNTPSGQPPTPTLTSAATTPSAPEPPPDWTTTPPLTPTDPEIPDFPTVYSDLIRYLSDFLTATQPAIVAAFAGLDGAVVIPVPSCDYPAVYVPGTRSDRVLLVAHYDTIPDHNGDPVSPVYVPGTPNLTNSHQAALGADDRFGCAALWALRSSGHSLLLLPDEEIGCVGSHYVADNPPEGLVRHNFAIQFDRRNTHDLVFYSCDNPDFTQYLVKGLPGFATATGSVSDISHLCPALGFAGVNISIGFSGEHRSGETGSILVYANTLSSVRRLLAEPTPEFEYRERPKPDYSQWYRDNYARYSSAAAGWNSSHAQPAPLPGERGFRPSTVYVTTLTSEGRVTQVRATELKAPCVFSYYGRSPTRKFYLYTGPNRYDEISSAYSHLLGPVTALPPSLLGSFRARTLHALQIMGVRSDASLEPDPDHVDPKAITLWTPPDTPVSEISGSDLVCPDCLTVVPEDEATTPYPLCPDCDCVMVTVEEALTQPGLAELLTDAYRDRIHSERIG